MIDFEKIDDKESKEFLKNWEYSWYKIKNFTLKEQEDIQKHVLEMHHDVLFQIKVSAFISKLNKTKKCPVCEMNFNPENKGQNRMSRRILVYDDVEKILTAEQYRRNHEGWKRGTSVEQIASEAILFWNAQGNHERFKDINDVDYILKQYGKKLKNKTSSKKKVDQWSELTSRKDHKCDFCSLLIPIGEKYHKYNGINEDALETPFYSVRYHGNCMNLISSLFTWDLFDDERFGAAEAIHFISSFSVVLNIHENEVKERIRNGGIGQSEIIKLIGSKNKDEEFEQETEVNS